MSNQTLLTKKCKHCRRRLSRIASRQMRHTFHCSYKYAPELHGKATISPIRYPKALCTIEVLK